MILSHRHRFIFIKTTKTAGTSFEIALSRLCGPEDIITPIAPEDEVLRRRHGGRGPQNHLAPWRSYGPKDWYRWLRKGRRKARFYNHMSAAELRRLLPPEVWNGYFKFCFERNPWDRVISFYYWKHKKAPRPSLAEFVRTGPLERLKAGGEGLYTIDGEVVVDRIYPYEALEAAMEDLCRRIGVHPPPELPRAKGGFRPPRRPYQALLGEAERDLIGRLFASEIQRMGYRF